jgi:hypothetical protein
MTPEEIQAARASIDELRNEIVNALQSYAEAVKRGESPEFPAWTLHAPAVCKLAEERLSGLEKLRGKR